MKLITAEKLPVPGGHYSHGAMAGKLLFISGQLPFPTDAQEFPEGIEAQTLQAMANIEAVLQAAGASLSHLVSVQIYIVDVAYWPIVNLVYSTLMGAHRPARVIIPCGPLHYGALVEISAVAELA
ncbi:MULTISPECIES: RidA family protein [unclassified Pseudomonas]|uniref:RidA family protein n=1 Tax=Pseudomonas TaxID=286 RepID=UPI000B819B78|nr:MULTISPECIES: RidA family protein [unclassified Pseudomonas]